MLPAKDSLFTFMAPPLPFFLESGRRTYELGEEHPNRTNLGVFDLLFVYSGALHIGEEEDVWSLESGDVLILRPDRYHYSVRPCSVETHFDWLHFQTAGMWEESDHTDHHSVRETYRIRLPKRMTPPYPEEAKEIFSQLHAAAEGSTQAAFWERQKLFLHLLQMLDEGWRSDTGKAAVTVAERAAAYLKMNYRAMLTNRMLGDALHLHPNYITRCMTQMFGLTPQQYLLNYRLEQAKLLLLKTDWPISRVAEEAGFRQTPHFSRSFSEHAGLSPLQYRKQFTN